MSEKRVYFNKPQRLTQLTGANTTVIVAGRRTGKTDSIAAPFVLRNMQRMPGSTGGIVVPTFKHGLTNTIPGLLAAWKRWGFIEGKHSYNHSIMILSDMPQTQKGSWFLHYRDKMDVELIGTIEATVYEIWRTKERIRALNATGKPVPPYLKIPLPRYFCPLGIRRFINVLYLCGREIIKYFSQCKCSENLSLLYIHV